MEATSSTKLCLLDQLLVGVHSWSLSGSKKATVGADMSRKWSGQDALYTAYQVGSHRLARTAMQSSA